MRRDDLATYLANFLRLGDFDDESLNGLQVEGRAEVRRIAFAVSACAQSFLAAADAGADALIVHHGLLWKGVPVQPVAGPWKERLRLLLSQELNLLAYHLPLDAHGEVGNNAAAARALGLEALEPFGEYHGMKIGWKGHLARPLPRGEFVARLEAFYGHPALVVEGGSDPVRSCGVVSGGAAKEAVQAAAESLDFYVTGEPSEPVTYLCRELGVNFAALGHYATERVGVRALADHLRATLGLETVFLELDNPA